MEERGLKQIDEEIRENLASQGELRQTLKEKEKDFRILMNEKEKMLREMTKEMFGDE